MLSSFLPAPKYAGVDKPDSNEDTLQPTTSSVTKPPIYGSAARATFTPSSIDDFGDGGAIPEYHVPQYPLNMGNKGAIQHRSNLAQLQIQNDGSANYDSIISQDMRKGVVVYTSYDDLIPKDVTDEELRKPTEGEIAVKTEETRVALLRAMNATTTSSSIEPTYVKYTPATNSGDGTQRIVRVHEKVQDPMEPARFRQRKRPAGPPSPPAPVMHSPPRKISKEDQAMWNVPPCISNWKNIKGYAIPVHMRLAADGRGIVEPVVNDKFSSFSETLYQTEMAARRALEEKSNLQKVVEVEKRSEREDQLKQLARQAREQTRFVGAASRVDDGDEANYEVAERDSLRKDMARERRREYRMSRRGTKRERRDREMDRDISERVALGQGAPAVGASGVDGLFDSRLFNKNSGMSTGFGADDGYDLYDKALFDRVDRTSIYRPSKDVDSEMYGDDDVKELLSKSAGKFKPDTGFLGAADKSIEDRGRDRPVQFVRDTTVVEDEDPFEVENFLGRPSKK